MGPRWSGPDGRGERAREGGARGGFGQIVRIQGDGSLGPEGKGGCTFGVGWYVDHLY